MRTFFFFSCLRTLRHDTWLVDKFTPALRMIKLLTLYGLSNHQASLLPDTLRITQSEKLVSSCVATCVTLKTLTGHGKTAMSLVMFASNT